MTPEKAIECVVEVTGPSTGDIALGITGFVVAVLLVLLVTRNREGGWGP